MLHYKDITNYLIDIGKDVGELQSYHPKDSSSEEEVQNASRIR